MSSQVHNNLSAEIVKFLAWAVKYVTWDNQVVHTLEKGIHASWPETWLGRHSGVSARLLWLFALGGAVISASTENNKAGDKIVTPYAAKNFDDLKLNPKNQETWATDIAGVHAYVLAHIISSEGFIAQAYDDNAGNGTLTLGSGFTINDRAHRDFAAHVLGRHIGNGARITVDENRQLVSQWLKQRIYPKIRQNLKRPVDSRLFVILAVAAYNKGENIYDAGNSGRPVIDAINAGKPKDDIIAAYVRAFAGIQGTRWGGLPNKYGLCALYYQGAVNDTTILNSIAEAPYTIGTYIKENKGRLVTYEGEKSTARANGIYNPGNIDELMLLVKKRVTKGTPQQPVANYLSQSQCQIIRQGRLGSDAADFQDFILNQNNEKLDASDELNAAGEELYFDKHYASAVKKFQAAIDKKPQNYIAYSNLAISYYKIGQPADGLATVQKLIRAEFFDDMPDDIRGYTYYNVALCRMALGDGAKNPKIQQEHYAMAMANLKLAEKFSGHAHKQMHDILKSKMTPSKKSVAAKMRGGTSSVKKKVTLAQAGINNLRDR